MEHSIDRWVSILRGKAAEYEHKARGNGEIVSSPDIDDICNEMLAFKDAILIQNGLMGER